MGRWGGERIKKKEGALFLWQRGGERWLQVKLSASIHTLTYKQAKRTLINSLMTYPNVLNSVFIQEGL